MASARQFRIVARRRLWGDVIHRGATRKLLRVSVFYINIRGSN